MASDANTNRSISVNSNGEATRPVEKPSFLRKFFKKKWTELSAHDAASEANRREKIRLMLVRVKFWTPAIAFGLFIGVAGLTRTLVQYDNSKSLIWLIPFAFLGLAVVVLLFGKKIGEPAKRMILSLIVALILFLAFVAFTFIEPVAFGVVDIYGLFVGNATTGQPGIFNALAVSLEGVPGVGLLLKAAMLIIGAVVSVSLVYILPVVFLTLLVKEITFEVDPSMKEILTLVFVAAVVFIFPIGQSIVGNLGI